VSRARKQEQGGNDEIEGAEKITAEAADDVCEREAPSPLGEFAEKKETEFRQQQAQRQENVEHDDAE